MRRDRIVRILMGTALVLSLVAGLIGLFWQTPAGPDTFVSVRGETVSLHARGLYRYDSVSMALQGMAQDAVTLLIALPATVAALIGVRRRASLRARAALLGLTGYYLYTYVSYVFLWQYNPLFLVYVAVMSLSFFSLVLQFMALSVETVADAMRPRMPVRLYGIYQILLAVVVGFLWIWRIATGIGWHAVPGLGHYTTLVIQALDLGFVVPLAVVSGVLLLRRRAWGYVLSLLVVFKGAMLGLAILAMIAVQSLNGAGDPVEMAVFALAVSPLCVLAVRLLRTIPNHREDRA